MTAAADAATVPTRVWDLPTRLFHWVLVGVVTGSVVTAQIGGNAMVWHFRFGYTAFTLLAFRLLWGFVGGRWSRFSSFLYGPAALRRYLRGQAHAHAEVGHNPLGSLSVYALLALLVAQVATGLVADDEISNVGPLNRFVSDATASRATGWHTQWGQWLIYGLVGVHVAAIVFYRWRLGRDLVRPMLTGDKPLPRGTPAAADRLATRLLALLLVGACAAAVAWVVSLGG